MVVFPGEKMSAEGKCPVTAGGIKQLYVIYRCPAQRLHRSAVARTMRHRDQCILVIYTSFIDTAAVSAWPAGETGNAKVCRYNWHSAGSLHGLAISSAEI